MQKSVNPHGGEPPTGEPCAGEPHARFGGGRSQVTGSSYPYRSSLRHYIDDRTVVILIYKWKRFFMPGSMGIEERHRGFSPKKSSLERLIPIDPSCMRKKWGNSS